MRIERAEGRRRPARPGLGIALVAGVAACGSDYDLVGGVDVNPGDVTECEFLPVPGTRISEYACNPVFPGESDERR